jgi:hypothetical protein
MRSPFIEPEPLTFSEQCEQAFRHLVLMAVLFPVLFTIADFLRSV